MPGPGPAPEADRAITDVVRWAAFSCLLVPVVLLWCGSSLAGATGIALGLAAVTGACHLLIRRSARAAARESSEEPSGDRPTGRAGDRPGIPAPHRGRHHRPRTPAHRTGGGAHRGGRHGGGDTPVG
ncbi:hypothetical protein N4P33_01420 [Streptomyces sp. 15-116A]|uniref:hypothetical protein n=1 Tax=Streptomyces sp. 15-116A TaxID=2259035 RepID=UPI0021B3B300|nr:hypothetical protein [Streptomyces sp. 15-116A]MCT7350842.1 hypothetical protein [Streptomyces sp. 15-116A]